MPLTKKGKKILSSMKKQYGNEKGIEVFYASKNKGVITKVDRVAKGGGINLKRGGDVDYASQDLEEQAAIDRGEPTAQMTTQERDDQGYGSGPTIQRGGKPDKPTIKQRAVSTGINTAAQYAFNKFTGLPGIMYNVAAKPAFNFLTKKTKERKTGTQIVKAPAPVTKTPPAFTPSSGDNDPNPIKILYKKKPVTQIAQAPKRNFDAKSFFPFKALKSGGVSSGPPPRKGPNSQMPVKMNSGGEGRKKKTILQAVVQGYTTSEQVAKNLVEKKRKKKLKQKALETGQGYFKFSKGGMKGQGIALRGKNFKGVF